MSIPFDCYQLLLKTSENEKNMNAVIQNIASCVQYPNKTQQFFHGSDKLYKSIGFHSGIMGTCQYFDDLYIADNNDLYNLIVIESLIGEVCIKKAGDPQLTDFLNRVQNELLTKKIAEYSYENTREQQTIISKSIRPLHNSIRAFLDSLHDIKQQEFEEEGANALLYSWSGLAACLGFVEMVLSDFSADNYISEEFPVSRKFTHEQFRGDMHALKQVVADLQDELLDQPDVCEIREFYAIVNFFCNLVNQYIYPLFESQQRQTLRHQFTLFNEQLPQAEAALDRLQQEDKVCKYRAAINTRLI